MEKEKLNERVQHQRDAVNVFGDYYERENVIGWDKSKMIGKEERRG